MTDVRGEPGQDLDELLTRWGSEQTGPWSRRPVRSEPRHAAPDAITSGDELGSFGAPAVASSGHSASPPAHQPDHPSWPAGTPSSQWAVSAKPRYEPPRAARSDEDTGRRHRPDGVPPSRSTRAGAAPNGVRAADLPLPSPAPPRRPGPAGPPRFDDAGAYAGWLSGSNATSRHATPDPAPADHYDAPAPSRPSPADYHDAPAPSRRSPSRYAPADYHDAPAPSRNAPADHYEAPRHAPVDPYQAPRPVDPYEAPVIRTAAPAGPPAPAGYSVLAAGPSVHDALAPYSPPAARSAVGPDPYAYADRRYAGRAEDTFGSDPYGGDDDEPPGRHRRLVGPARNRRPRWVRALGWVGAFLGILLVAGGGFAAYQYKKLSGNITRVDALAPTDGSIRDAAKQLDAENYLLIGSDSRDGENSAYGAVSGARSDTTILAHLSPKRDKVVLISFPRDSWVSLPACPKTGGGTSPAQDGQFNEAFTTGGPSCTVLAVQKLTGVKINHYVQVDFKGFKTMVDALNGVPICTTTPLRDEESGLRLPAGTTTLKGEQALAFVRARYGIGDGSDLGRIQRQQSFLGAMVRAATGTKLLVNPVALTKFLGAATKSLTLDRQTSFGDLKQLADQLHGLDPKKVSFLTAPIANPAYTPPGFPQPPSGQGGSRVLLDETAGRVLYDSIINDKPAAPKTATPAKPDVLTVAPAEVSVRVLNGVGTAKLGSTVSADLVGVGFATVTPSNAPVTPVTTVRYGPDDKDEALTLAAAVPGAVLQPDVSTDLDLVVGTNYTGVKQVKIGDPATPKAATPKVATPKAAAPAITAADSTCR